MIYAIRAVDTRYIKIGRAKNPTKRLMELQVCNPHELKLIACAEWPDSEEPLIHMYLEVYCQRGEWFVRTPQVEKIINLLRDDQNGLTEWHRISRTGNERPMDLKFKVVANG